MRDRDEGRGGCAGNHGVEEGVHGRRGHNQWSGNERVLGCVTIAGVVEPNSIEHVVVGFGSEGTPLATIVVGVR